MAMMKAISFKKFHAKSGSKFINIQLPLLYMFFFVLMSQNIYADSKVSVGNAVNGITSILKVVAIIIGIIMVIVGIVRLVISYNEMDGGEQLKSVMLIATGIAMCIIVAVISNLGFKFSPPS